MPKIPSWFRTLIINVNIRSSSAEAEVACKVVFQDHPLDI